jgi:Flp pilus assembly protein TadG
MNKFRNEDGQVLVITALCMVAFLGFLALATDIGALYNSKRQLQTAADAAATAAAVRYLSLYNADNSNAAAAQASAITAGQAAATANVPGSTPTVNVNTNAASPPSHQHCVATNCYFEAIVSAPNPTVFYKAFLYLWKGTTTSGFNVAARAVAGTPGSSSGCAFLTNQSGSAYAAQGNYTVNATTCGIFVNSTSSSAMTAKGNAGSVNAAYVDAVGSTSGYTVNFSNNTVVTGNTVPETIPFSDITVPTQPATCTGTATGTQTLSGTVSPGCYLGTVNFGTANLLPGFYFFGGDVNMKNGAVTNSTNSSGGVTLDINAGTLTVKPGNAQVTLTPPTAGDGTNGTAINGVSIYQPFSNKNSPSFQAGSSNIVLGGFVYAPGAQISVQDNGGTSTFGGLVVDSIASGPSTINVGGYSSSTSPLKVVTLVE